MFLFDSWKQQESRFFWKVQVSCQVVESCLCQVYWLVVLFRVVCIIPSYNNHVTIFRIKAIFHVTIWLRNRKVWATKDLSYPRRNIEVLDMTPVRANFFFDLSCRNSCPQCDLFLPSRPLEWKMAYSFFYHSFSSLRSPNKFYSKRGEQIAHPDIIGGFYSNRDMPSSQSQWFLQDG